MPHPRHPERFHALDATRAFALLLGVFFHGVWFYAHGPMNTGVKDVGANHFYSWCFHASHTFRMQAFYLIAGFFARLVVQKRGSRRFVKNRLLRIGVPLLVGWFILFPLLIAVWAWGRNLSGFNAVEVPPGLVYLGVIFSGAIFVERSSGGAFGLAHLWFLYYLIFFYFVTLFGRWAVGKTPLGKAGPLEKMDRMVRFLVTTPRGALVLALVLSPFLWSMKDWSGVDTPGFQYVPVANVTVVYLVFFLLGWFFHRQAKDLGSFFRQWRLYLGVGFLASIALYVFYDRVKPYDARRPHHAISYRDVSDWSKLQAGLLQGEDLETEGGDLPLAQLWSSLGPGHRELLRQESLTFDQRYGILTAINAILADPDYLTGEFRPTLSFKELRRFDPTVIPAHREALQPDLPGVAAGDYREEDWYYRAKAGFSLLYSLVMVFLVYGLMGAFQSLCDRFSATWRYLADSSYWVYLIHLPLLPAVETLVFDHHLTPLLKLPLVLLATLLLLYASYHYLVRSTFIGKLLNGRAYPFHWNPLEAIRAIPDAPKSLSIDPAAVPPAPPQSTPQVNKE